MRIKFSLKLSLLLLFIMSPSTASLTNSEILDNAKINMGIKYLSEEHSERRDAFIDKPAETSQESVNSAKILNLLSDATKVSKKEATADQKCIIATSVMATVFIHNGAKRLNRNHLKETDVLYRHFRALELIEDLSVQLNEHLIDVDGFKTVDTTHLSTIWHNFSDLDTYSKITKNLFELWFNEALKAHNDGFVKLAEIAKAKNSDLTADARRTEDLSPAAKQNTVHITTESIDEHNILAKNTGFFRPEKRLSFETALLTSPSRRQRTATTRTNIPFQNGHVLETQINDPVIQFRYYRVSDDSNDPNYLGLHMTQSDFELRIKAAKAEDLQGIYQQMMNESRNSSEEESEQEREFSTENIIEAFVNYYLGTGQLKMASTILTGTPLCVWKHENETLALQSIFLNGTILSDDSTITSIHERINKLDESLIHLYHTNDDFYDSLELVKKKNAFKQEPIVRRSYFSNQIQVKALTAVGLATGFAFVFAKFSPGTITQMINFGIKFLPYSFRTLLGGKKG